MSFSLEEIKILEKIVYLVEMILKHENDSNIVSIVNSFLSQKLSVLNTIII